VFAWFPGKFKEVSLRKKYPDLTPPARDAIEEASVVFIQAIEDTHGDAKEEGCGVGIFVKPRTAI